MTDTNAAEILAAAIEANERGQRFTIKAHALNLERQAHDARAAGNVDEAAKLDAAAGIAKAEWAQAIAAGKDPGTVEYQPPPAATERPEPGSVAEQVDKLQAEGNWDEAARLKTSSFLEYQRQKEADALAAVRAEMGVDDEDVAARRARLAEFELRLTRYHDEPLTIREKDEHDALQAQETAERVGVAQKLEAGRAWASIGGKPTTGVDE